MGYREIAAKQRGLLLHSQVTEEEYNEAVTAGFIGIPPYEQDQELMKYVHYTELAEYSYIDAYYRDWLIAFPTIPPEKRHPTPYIAGMRALRIQRFSTSWTMEPSSIITPPELMPYTNKDIGFTYIVDENITPDNWVLANDIPVEKVIPAMRKHYEYVTIEDFDDAVFTAFSAYRRGYSWDEIAWAIEPAAGVWYSDKTGKRPTNGKELLELFFEEHTPAPRQTDNEPE